jgi:hypothetical protein
MHDTTRPTAGTDWETRGRQATLMVVQDIIELSQKLLDSKLADEKVWFRNLLLGILNSAQRDYRSVEIGVKKSPYLAAWGARNLLELRVITAFVVRSEQNALEFKGDFASDLAEFWTAVIKTSVASHPQLVKIMRELAADAGSMEEAFLKAASEEQERGAPITEPRGEAAAIKQVMNESSIDRDRTPRPIKEMAKEVGLIDIYGPRSKMYSKLVHPTALSIASSTTAGGLDALTPLFECQAGTDLLMIYSSVKDHVDAHGIAPKGDPVRAH